MAAERDTKQGMTFVYSNFYHLYRQGKLQAAVQRELTKGVVLKPSHLHEVSNEVPVAAEVQVMSSADTEQLKNWSQYEGAAKRELAAQVRSLRDARKRLAFLMGELDQILKRD